MHEVSFKFQIFMSKNAVIIYSGGMDSFTVLHKAIALGYTPFALSFNYGQKHKKELQYAKKVCERLRIDHKIVDISSINQLLGGSALIDDIAMPEGHYHEPSMKQTVVPNRNMILLSLAIAQAVSIDAKTVFYGAHSGDHAIYPDCRPEFVEKMNAVSQIANYEAVEILSPYLLQTKADILADGLSMGLDYEQTWTCYNGREHACGKCGACQERLEAFAINNTIDPLSYE